MSQIEKPPLFPPKSFDLQTFLFGEGESKEEKGKERKKERKKEGKKERRKERKRKRKKEGKKERKKEELFFSLLLSMKNLDKGRFQQQNRNYFTFFDISPLTNTISISNIYI